jgi:aspartate oxidase
MGLRTAVLVLVVLGGSWAALMALTDLMTPVALVSGTSIARSASNLASAGIAVALGIGIFWRRDPNPFAAAGLLVVAIWHLVSVASIGTSVVMLLLGGLLSFLVKRKGA